MSTPAVRSQRLAFCSRNLQTLNVILTLFPSQEKGQQDMDIEEKTVFLQSKFYDSCEIGSKASAGRNKGYLAVLNPTDRRIYPIRPCKLCHSERDQSSLLTWAAGVCEA